MRVKYTALYAAPFMVDESEPITEIKNCMHGLEVSASVPHCDECDAAYNAYREEEAYALWVERSELFALPTGITREGN